MKNFIVIAVSLPLMLALMCQLSLSHVNNLRLQLAMEYIYAAREEAKQEGYFSDSVREELKERIAKLYGIDPSRVIIEGDTALSDIKYRNRGERFIHYRVSFPAGRLVLDILTRNSRLNKSRYVIDNYTPSEKLFTGSAS